MGTDLAVDDGLEPLDNPHTPFPPEVILAGLYALAATGGTATKAQALLKETYGDQTPDDRTLIRWRTETFPRRYQHILAEKSVEIETLVEHQLRESTRLAGLTKHKILTRLYDTADSIDPKELGKTAQQLAVTEGVGLDKLLTLTGRPNQITENRDAHEILRALEGRYGTATDTTAEEDTDPASV